LGRDALDVAGLMMRRWRVYLVQCRDGTFYTGITTDVARRLSDHAAGRGAKYTRGRGPLVLWWVSEPLTHGEALAWERRIKKWRHDQKQQLRGPAQ
jgi:putative endonuclease